MREGPACVTAVSAGTDAFGVRGGGNGGGGVVSKLATHFVGQRYCTLYCVVYEQCQFQPCFRNQTRGVFNSEVETLIWGCSWPMSDPPLGQT